MNTLQITGLTSGLDTDNVVKQLMQLKNGR